MSRVFCAYSLCIALMFCAAAVMYICIFFHHRVGRSSALSRQLNMWHERVCFNYIPLASTRNCWLTKVQGDRMRSWCTSYMFVMLLIHDLCKTIQSSGSSFHRGPDPRRGEVDRISKAAKCQPSVMGAWLRMFTNVAWIQSKLLFRVLFFGRLTWRIGGIWGEIQYAIYHVAYSSILWRFQIWLAKYCKCHDMMTWRPFRTLGSRPTEFLWE